MHRRLPVLALAALLGFASACTRTGDLTGPDTAHPDAARFSESDDNGGMFGNGNVAGGSDEGGLGSGTGGVVGSDDAGQAESDGIVESAGNGGMIGNGN